MQNSVGSDRKSSSLFRSLHCYGIYDKVPINVTSAQGTTQNTLYITWRTNDPLGQSICSSNYTYKSIQNCCHEKWWM